MPGSDTAPVWKKVYITISGGNRETTGDVIDQVLKMCNEQLVSGFLQYPAYTKESLQIWKDIPGLKDFVSDNELVNFINLLSKELNVEVTTGWTIICNYLMFDYFGKIDELKCIIKYDTNARCLIDNIWYFYTADRMFLLKTLRHIFENACDKKHKFYKEFDNFFKTINTNVLWNNLVKCFENLINEIDKDSVQIVSSESIERWVHKNNREQLDVVLLLIHAIRYCKLDGYELEKILVLFMRHGFTRHPLYQDSNNISKPNDLMEIKCAEIGCLLAIVERYWKQPGIAKLLPQNMERNLELLQLQGDNSIILFAWVVLKTSINPTGRTMEYCNTITCDLVERRVFNSLHSIITNRIFSKCKAGDFVVDGVFQLMAEFIKICADYAYLHEQDGIGCITAELIMRKGIVVLDYLGPIFQLSLDAFPLVFNPFLEMCRSLMSLPDYYDRIMKLLKNIPGYLTELPWNSNRDKCRLLFKQKIFDNSHLFEMPEGTELEKFRYQGMDLARFIYPFSFFLLMEQFITSHFEIHKTWNCYENLGEMVYDGFKFILFILKNYKGDFQSDTVLRKLIQRLEVVPGLFSEGSTKNFNFMRLYFELHVTMVTHNLLDFSEAFPLIIRRTFLPQPLSPNSFSEDVYILQFYSESVLFKCLKEEESMSDHSLLIEYLKLVEDMVQKDLYHQEVQTAGVWYMLNVAFPLHQQWPYADQYQKMEVSRYCISTFVKLMQKYRKNGPGPESEEICNMCRDGFFYEEVLISGYLSMFYKDKFYMLNLMETESDWINGPTLIYIDIIRLQMVLLLLVYQQNMEMPDRKGTALSNHITAITKAVSAYMVNPYSTVLRVLSFRFLEVLAGDEDIPLMALLGLDYDQIQRLFLDKLRDPMEDDNVKLHILELVSNCVYYQHGMTAAFFNVKRSRRWYSDNKEKTIEGDTVTDFMIDYLQNIRKSHEYLRYPLQQAILRVMTNLWLSGKQHLVKNIVVLKAFWPLLIDPLYREYDQKPEVYTYILKILSTQLTKPGSSQIKFLFALEKFLTDDKLLVLWQQYILTTIKSGGKPHELEEKQQFLKAWMEFVMCAENEMSLRKFTTQKIKYLFVRMCLSGFQYSLVNMHCLETWMNLCVVHFSKYGLHFGGKDESVARKMVIMFKMLKPYYIDINHNTRSAIMTIALNTIIDLRAYFQRDVPVLFEFLEQIGAMMDTEYTILEENVWSKLEEYGPLAREIIIPWMLFVNIANRLLKWHNVDDCAVWFKYRNYLPRIVKCTSDLFNNKETLPLAKLGIRSLILYMQSPLAYDFMNIDLMRFYDSIEPHITYLLTGAGNIAHPSKLEEGWTTCLLLMQFNQAFLKRFQVTALPSCYSFMSLHEPMLQHIIHIPDFTVSLKALDLLLNTLTFFDNLLRDWQLKWLQHSPDTYHFVVMGIKRVINSCLYVILRPKNITVYELDDYSRLNQIEKIPIVLMVGIMNRLIMAVGLGFSILYRTNANLIDLMDVCLPNDSTVLILNDFSVPKFELPVPYDLTYGKLLCLAHFMCKTLDTLNFGENPVVRDPRGRDYRARDARAERKYMEFVGLVEHQRSSENLPHQKLSAFLRYAMYEYSGLADPWIQKLDYRKVDRSLEQLMFFLSQQVYIYVKVQANTEGLPYYKRNLASELQFFYEFVKRHTSILLNQEITVSLSLRSMSSFKAETDIMKRYLSYCQENNKMPEVVDKNFCLVFFHWFTWMCHLR